MAFVRAEEVAVAQSDSLVTAVDLVEVPFSHVWHLAVRHYQLNRSGEKKQ